MRASTWRSFPVRALAPSLVVAGTALAVAIAGCGDGEDRAGSFARSAEVTGGTDTAREIEPDVVATDADWEILRRKIEWARDEGLDTLAVGAAVARLGATFVGTPYEPATLEISGRERLVVNLRQLDCVTFVESVLAMVHTLHALEPGGESGGDGGRRDGMDETSLRDAYVAALTRIRYRSGVLDGYPSRLHYFSEWIQDGERKGIVRDVTTELGGVTDPEPIDFMSTNPGAYRQLGDPDVLSAIRAMEARVSTLPRAWIPQDRIGGVAERIRDGDVIAATSTVPGLDVAHTGIAYRTGGELHLLHAPLVGDSVEISELPLARRIAGIGGQDGILVARPLAP